MKKKRENGYFVGLIFITNSNTFYLKSANFTFMCVFYLNDNFDYQN